MVACVSLLYDTHARGGRANGFHSTTCGLCVQDEYLPAGLFADLAEVTCQQCRSMAAATGAGSDEKPADPKALMRGLVEGLLNARVTVQRLHQIFPNWTARIDELMTDEDRVFVRFDVDFTDPFGLIGEPGTASRSGQAAVFRLAENLISEVRPIVDDFGLWDEGPTEWPRSAQAHTRTTERETAS